MSSYEREMSKWNPRYITGITELLKPMASPRETTRLFPEKPVTLIDQCLHIPGKADSAYSSFSGGSNIPEYPLPLCYNEHDSLPPKQLSYMDLGYVRGIYDPSTIDTELKCVHENQSLGKGSCYKWKNAGHSRANESTPPCRMQPSTASAKLPPPLSPPPFPSAQVRSYNTNSSVPLAHSGLDLDRHVQLEVCPRVTNKGNAFDAPENCHNDYCFSRCDHERLIIKEGDTCYVADQSAAKNSKTSTSTELSCTFQEYLKSRFLTRTQKAVSAQNLPSASPEVMNSESFPSLHTSPTAVNDTQENKQYFCAGSVHKPPVQEADLPNTLAGPRNKESQLDGIQYPCPATDHSSLDQAALESCVDLACVDSSLSSTAAFGIINSYKQKKCFFNPEEEKCKDGWQQLLKQQTRMQKPAFHGLDFAEAPCSEVYQITNTRSYYTHDAVNSASQSLNGLRKTKQKDVNSSPDLLESPRHEEMITSVHFSNQQFSTEAESQSQNDSARIKINRKTTPLLYYLSGGKNSNFLSHECQAREQKDFAMRSQSSNASVSAASAEIPKDSKICMDDAGSSLGELILGSPTSSVDEKFNNDYRERLKIAQRKVLRETSFKRKDLQMSLPVRLKQKPSSRPSIQHFRSLSLSSTNEDSKSISFPRPLESISMDEELKRPQTARIGGRKRATKEQKKISYSEPEKLNQLDDQKDQSVLWRKKNARSRSDEIHEQDSWIFRSKAQENQGRTLSKAELKQIQHKALIEYMERKIGQRPASAPQSGANLKPPLQMKISSLKGVSEDATSRPSVSRNLQKADDFCQFSGKILEPPPFSSALTSKTSTLTDGCSASPLETVMAQDGAPPAGSEGHCNFQGTSARNFLHLGSAFSKGPGRLISVSSPVQDFYRSAACTTLSTQDHEYYVAGSNSLTKEQPEADALDRKDHVTVPKQNAKTGGRRGVSVEGTETAEMIRLSSLSQNTDDVHHLKNHHLSSGLETCKNNQGANIPQHFESALGNLLKQSHADHFSGLRGLNSRAREPHSINELSNTRGSSGNSGVAQVPQLSVGRLSSSNVQVMPLCTLPAPSPAEADNEVFVDFLANSSEITSNVLSFPGQSSTSAPDRKIPESASAAPASQISTGKPHIKGKYDISFPVSEKEESALANSEEKENSVGNSYGAQKGLELPALFSYEKNNKHFHLKTVIRGNPPVSSESEKPLWEQLDPGDAMHCSENSTPEYCRDLLDNQRHKKASHPLANVNILQNEPTCSLPMKETDLSMLKSAEDQQNEALAVEILAKDKSLFDILAPNPIRKSVSDLMEGLFPVNISLLDRSCRRKKRIQLAQGNHSQRSNERAADSAAGTGNYLRQRAEGGTILIDQTLSKTGQSLDDTDNIMSKKRELISSIQLKLQALWDEKEFIHSEAEALAVRGKELESTIQGLCKPNEYERYTMFIGDLEKVVNLLLCLSSRLARVQNAIDKVDENTDAEEKQSLNERHRLLSRQREDAKDLKDNLDRREGVVSGILSKYLTESQLQAYKHFVQEKTSLLIEQKDLEEQIKFLEEQMEKLKESISS